MRHLTRTEFRHEPDEKVRWQTAADAVGLSLSEFIRAALDHASAGTALPETKVVVQDRMDPLALRLLRGAANNLNQVVHSGHIAKSFELATITAIAEEITALVRADLDKIRQGTGETTE